MIDIFKTVESEVRSYCRSFPAVFDSAKGALLQTVDRKRYIDFFAAAGSLNYGHNPEALKRALLEHVERDAITTSLDLHTTAKAVFLERMRDIILRPRKLDYRVQFTGPTGANAVEAAIKLARKVTGRRTIVAFTNAYHGLSLGALCLTGNDFYRRSSASELQGSVFMPFDGYLGEGYNTLDLFEAMLADPSSGLGCPAAVVVETIQGEGGVNIASDEWLQRLSKLCHAYSMLLIVDDIQVGCGRTGTFFSFERSGIVPDIVLLSKSLSGYGLPLSVALIRPHIDCWEPGEHTGTFRGNNLAFVTAAKALESYWTTSDLADNVRRCESLVRSCGERLAQRVGSDVLRVRGRGLIFAFECQSPSINARSLSRSCFDSGLIVETCGRKGSSLKIIPPLTIDTAILEEGLTILEGVVNSAFNCAPVMA